MKTSDLTIQFMNIEISLFASRCAANDLESIDDMDFYEFSEDLTNPIPAEKEVVALTGLQKIALARFEEEFNIDRNKWFSAGELKFRVPTLQALAKRGFLVERTGESTATVYKLKG